MFCIKATTLSAIVHGFSGISQFGRVAAHSNQRSFMDIQCQTIVRRIDMADLRITGVSNNQLELQAPDGSRHYLEISEDLLKALKTRQSALPVTISPREIQQQIRLGATVEDIIKSSGSDEDLIYKFAAPIIAELNHVVSLARNVRLSLAGDRFTDPTQVEFGVVMDERLAQNGSNSSNWSAKKSLEGDWLVTVSFVLSDGSGSATWSFDPKQLFLVPENETALQLSNGLAVTAAANKIRNIEPETTTNFIPPVVDIEETFEEVAQTAGLTVVPEIVEVEETVYETEDEVIVDVSARNVFHVVEDSADEIADEYLDEPLVEELFEAHTEEPTVEMQITKQTIPIEDQPVVEETAETETDSSPKPQSTSRWAEVLFGAKADEEEN
jgi:hypothetical protein